MRIAAVQMLSSADPAANLATVVERTAEAAALGAQLVVFPETFLSLYPSYAWAHLPASGAQGDEFWERFWGSSVAVDGPEVGTLVEACREHDVHVAIGVNEREDDRPGSVYNSLLLLGPDGLRDAGVEVEDHGRGLHGSHADHGELRLHGHGRHARPRNR